MESSKKEMIKEILSMLNRLSVIGLAKVVGFATALLAGEGKKGKKGA